MLFFSSNFERLKVLFRKSCGVYPSKNHEAIEKVSCEVTSVVLILLLLSSSSKKVLHSHIVFEVVSYSSRPSCEELTKFCIILKNLGTTLRV